MIDVGMFCGIHFYECANGPFVFLHDGDDSSVMHETIEEVSCLVGITEMGKRNEAVEGICCIGSCAGAGGLGKFNGVGRAGSDGGFVGVQFGDCGRRGANEHELGSCKGVNGIVVLKTVSFIQEFLMRRGY